MHNLESNRFIVSKMDQQMRVPLRVVLKDKSIRLITEDYEVLEEAIKQVDNVVYDDYYKMV
jgi:hypothetical protein